MRNEARIFFARASGNVASEMRVALTRRVFGPSKRAATPSPARTLTMLRMSSI